MSNGQHCSRSTGCSSHRLARWDRAGFAGGSGWGIERKAASVKGRDAERPAPGGRGRSGGECQASVGLTSASRASRPLTNLGDSSVLRVLASSTASAMATPSGTPSP